MSDSPIYLDKRPDSPNWYIHVYNERTGLVDRTSTRTRDRAKAEQRLAEYILKTPTKTALNDPTLTQVLLRYWELHMRQRFGKGAVKTVMGIVAEKLPHTRLSEFTRPAQRAWVEGLGVATATQKRYLGVIQSAVQFVFEREEIPAMPKFFRVKVIKGKGAAPLSLTYLQMLCEASKVPAHRLFMALSIGTLSRPCALLDLTWDRVDFEHRVIHLQPPDREPTKKVRPTVPMGDSLAAYLLAVRPADDSGRPVGGLVINRNGARYQGHRTMFDRLKRRAKVTGSAYGIRKAGGTWLRAQGVPELDVKGMLGHRMSGPTEDYAHFRPEYMRASADATEALLRAVNPSWMKFETGGSSHPQSSDLAAVFKNGPQVPDLNGAGKGARTLDLNLGKVSIPITFQLLRAANDD